MESRAGFFRGAVVFATSNPFSNVNYWAKVVYQTEEIPPETAWSHIWSELQGSPLDLGVTPAPRLKYMKCDPRMT